MAELTDPRAIAYEENLLKDRTDVKGGELHENVDRLEKIIMHNPECGIYQRGGMLVEISDIPTTIYKKIKRPRDVKTIVPIKSSRVRETGTRYAKWSKIDGRSKKSIPIDCPKDVSITLVERHSWKIPVLSSVIGAPTITPDGRLLNRHGYDPETGLYVDCGDWESIKQSPTRADALKALDIPLDIISEFPFIDEAARATWLASLFTSLIRWSLPTAPYFLFDAPVMASGKTLLATLVSLICTGNPPATMSQPRDETELKKGLLSVLMSGDSPLLIDNVEQILSSETLCVISTSPIYKDRILGESKNAVVSTAVTVFFTGNNILVRGDLSTRVIISRLDPKVEHPEERTFKRDNLKEYVLDNRQTLVNAVLTILKAYHVAGQPSTGLKPFGRFEEWDAFVRSPLIWLGTADPCETRNRIEQSDPEREQLGELLSAWWEMYGGKEILIKKMVSDISTGGDEKSDVLRDVLHGIAADGTRINSRRLGRRISHWEGRICRGLRIVRGAEVHKTQAWKLEQVGGFTGSTGYSPSNVKDCQTKNSIEVNKTPETHITPRLYSFIEKACSGLSISQEEFISRLSSDDLRDLELGKMTKTELRDWAVHFDKEIGNDR